MELEAEDEEWETRQQMSQPNANNSGGKVNWVFNRGIRLGKQVLMAGLVASSAPLVLPPLVVASAIGLTVSVPYAFFLASHACTQNLMSKLLPRPDIEILDINKETPLKGSEENRDTEMVDAQYMKNGENITSGNDYGQGVVEVAPELSHSQDVNDVFQQNGCCCDNNDNFCEGEEEKVRLREHDNVKLGAAIDGGMEGHLGGEINEEQPMNEGNGVVTTIEGLDEIGSEIENFETPFQVSIVLEECEDQVKEGDIEEEELQRETKGLLEKIRDEGRIDREGDESDQEIGLVIDNMEVAQEEKHGWETEGRVRNEEDPKVCEEMVQSRNDGDYVDSICIEVEIESSEPVSSFLEGEEFNNTNGSQKPMAEQYEKIQVESIGGLVMEMKVHDTSVTEVSSEVTGGKADAHTIFEEELKPLLGGPTAMQKGELYSNISDFVSQESQLHEYIEGMDSSDADAREIADESGLHLYDEKILDSDVHTCTIDLQEEPSNVRVDGDTDSMEVLVLSAEPESRPSECSSEENIICPSQELVFDEGNVWKQINAIRKIIGYEGTAQASCADELKALYIFTGVEPPTFLKQNLCDPAEINEKLHFLMSIVGIKSNMA
ncbi:uncharacterized protein LOC130718695 [Lotus japonicus]|uniref:uncharacterized protein LOC130718695 n=1 Tax=Lotus japonicus TaxID=34305 RepID=UPI00258F871A|nr:uncharacterized protein LOC130718695 [Lotus japonicus]